MWCLFPVPLGFKGLLYSLKRIWVVQRGESKTCLICKSDCLSWHDLYLYNLHSVSFLLFSFSIVHSNVYKASWKMKEDCNINSSEVAHFQLLRRGLIYMLSSALILVLIGKPKGISFNQGFVTFPWFRISLPWLSYNTIHSALKQSFVVSLQYTGVCLDLLLEITMWSSLICLPILVVCFFFFFFGFIQSDVASS